MRPERPRIAVVGGGIAGLTLAAALRPEVAEVTIHEAQPERTTGAALGLWPAARRALGEVGVEMPETAVDTRAELRRLDGRRLATAPTPHIGQVLRPELMIALDAAVPPTVRRVTAEVGDPRALDADLVVGADGVRSRVRALVDARAAERIPTAWVTLRGVTAASTQEGVAPSHGREYWGRDCLFGDAPLPGARYWFTAHRSALGPEPLDPAVVRAEATSVFASAAPEVRRVVETAAPDGLLATRLWVAPPMRRYRCGRYVVIGDAAHASLPNLARGASDAVLDAVTLAAALNAGRDLRAWNARRLVATQTTRMLARGVMTVATGGPRRGLERRRGPSTGV